MRNASVLTCTLTSREDEKGRAWEEEDRRFVEENERKEKIQSGRIRGGGGCIHLYSNAELLHYKYFKYNA